MMLIEPEAVIAESIYFFPGIEMFGVGAHCHAGVEMTRRQRIGQFGADLQMIEMFAIGEQVEDKDPHGHSCMAVWGEYDDVTAEGSMRAVWLRPSHPAWSGCAPGYVSPMPDGRRSYRLLVVRCRPVQDGCPERDRRRRQCRRRESRDQIKT